MKDNNEETINLLKKQNSQENKLNYNTVIVEDKENDEKLVNSIINEENKIKTPVIDKLLSEGNYSSYQITVIFFACFIMFIDGIHMSLLSSLFIPTKEFFKATEMKMSFISSILFLGVGSGSIFSSFGTKICPRTHLINISLLLTSVLTLSLTMVVDINIYIIVRFSLGFVIGILIPIVMNVMCEYLPIQGRSFIIISVGIWFNFAVIFLNVIMLYVMPNLEFEKLSTIYVIISCPIFLITVYFLIYLKESPRSLILDRKFDEAIIILEDIIKRSLTPDEKETLFSEANNSISDNVLRGDFCSLFSKEFVVITWISVSIWAISSFVIYGGLFTLSMLLKNVMKETNNQTIKSQIYIYVLSSPGCLIAAFLTETKFFGRKFTTLIGFILIALINVVGIIDNARISTYFGFMGIFIGISFNAIGCYNCEVYPTKIRDMALGFLYSSMRFSGFLSQYISMLLMLINPLSLFYLTVVLGIISAYLTYLLPYDTYGRPLDIHEP